MLQLHLDMPPGDILVFLTGQEEIESLSLLLQEKVKLLFQWVPGRPLEWHSVMRTVISLYRGSAILKRGR